MTANGYTLIKKIIKKCNSLSYAYSKTKNGEKEKKQKLKHKNSVIENGLR